MHLAPYIYLRRVFVQAAIAWILLRLVFVFLAIRAEWPEPAKLAPNAAVLLIGLVSAVTWVDLRRRNLLVLLPNLGMSVPSVLAITAGIAVVAELIATLVVL